MTKEEIIAAITEADKKYYTNGTSDITDYEYDELKRALRAIDPDNEILKSLGEDHTEGYSKVTHSVRMLSLEKIQANKEDPSDMTPICEWIHAVNTEYPGTQFVVEPKVDGMSAELVYKNGVLESASTRGNGDQGDDITSTLVRIGYGTIDGLKEFSKVCVRGELYISKDEFDRINAQQRKLNLPEFANARNLCAGTVKCAEATDRKVSFVVHGFGEVCPEFAKDTYSQQLELVNQLGFNTISSVSNLASDSDIWSNICAIGDKLRDTYPFYIDGAVVKIDNRKIQNELGETDHHPRWAVAYKFVPEAKYTVVKKIEWQVGGKTGKITPVAVFDPINICGSVVTKASLSNAGLMAHNGITEGCAALVEKANEIIPHIVSVVDGSDYSAELPKTMVCPACGKIATLVVGKSGYTADYVCDNPDCPGKRSDALKIALGSSGLNVLGIGPEICDAFIKKFPTMDAIDIVGLAKSEYPDTLSDLQKDKLYKEVKAARECSLKRWIVALQIPGVSEGTASKLSQGFRTLSELVKALQDTVIPMDISTARREACVKVLIEDGKYQKMLDCALNPVSDNYVDRAEGALPLDGLNFVVTGTFQYGRKNIEDLIPKLGGCLKGSVSKKVQYLVTGTDVGATKTNKAKELGTIVITESEFFDLVEKKKSELANDNHQD